jgi:large subunit ribosomal protein L29
MYTEMTDEQLVHKELALERQLLTARFQHATNQLEDSSQLLKLRREIARVRTAERGREIEQGIRKNGLRDAYRSSFDASQVVESTTEDAAAGGFLKGIVDKLGGTE